MRIDAANCKRLRIIYSLTQHRPRSSSFERHRLNSYSADNSPGAPRGTEWSLAGVLFSALLALAVFAAVELHSFLGKPLSDTPELRVAVVAREMLHSGDYVLPTLGGEPRLKKPPMPYWLAALSAKIFFNGSFDEPRNMSRAAQFPPAFSAALAVFFTAVFGSVLFSRTAGLMAGAILGSFELVMRFAQIGYCDSTLMLCCAISAFCLSRILSSEGGIFSALLGGLALGFGILTKGHIPLALLIAPCSFAVIVQRGQLRAKNYALLASMFALALAISIPWFVMVEQRHPGAIKELFSEASDSIQQPGIVATESGPHPQSGHRQNDRWTYYLYKGVFGLLPWSFLLLIEFCCTVPLLLVRRRRPERSDSHLHFFLIYSIAGFFIFYFAAKKQDYYLLPLLPAFALVLGAVHARMNTPGGFVEERMGWVQHFLGATLAAVLLCAPWWPAILERLQSAGIGRAGYLASHVTDLSAALGKFAIPLAFAILVVNFFCARQWIAGRGHIVIFLFAALSLSATAFNAVNPNERSRNEAFWKSLSKLDEAVGKKDSTLIAPGLDDSLVLFYTGKKARSIRDLSGDSIHGAVTILVQGDSLKNAARAFKFDLAELSAEVSSGFSTLILAEDSPQLAGIRKALKAWASSRKDSSN